METVIKNIHLIADKLVNDEFTNLEHGALQYRKFSRITFKILSFDDHTLKIQTIQTKSPQENYLDEIGLIDRTRDLFARFFPFHKIIVNAVPFVESHVDKVTPAYIRNFMTEMKIKVKDIVASTGIDKTNVSAWINGTREMSQPVKAMFYYYFEYESIKTKIKP